MKTPSCFFALALLLVQCSSDPVGPKLGEEFDLKIGERVVVQNQNLFIKFKTVDGDSRCPEGAMCLWAGNAKVFLLVSREDIALNTYLDPKLATYSNYTIRLVVLNPPPRLNDPIDSKEYVARLLVTKN
ncbi:MAG: hypothetical protein HW412_2017 [Bacteroidetes bacterium]|nr:hypothetical protein [Bacteroidota bacterium]